MLLHHFKDPMMWYILGRTLNRIKKVVTEKVTKIFYIPTGLDSLWYDPINFEIWFVKHSFVSE